MNPEETRSKFVGPLPPAPRLTFQQAAEEFSKKPALTYEQMLEQLRRSKAQRAKMEKEESENV